MHALTKKCINNATHQQSLDYNSPENRAGLVAFVIITTLPPFQFLEKLFVDLTLMSSTLFEV